MLKTLSCVCVCGWMDARKTGCKSIRFLFCCHRNLTSLSFSLCWLLPGARVWSEDGHDVKMYTHTHILATTVETHPSIVLSQLNLNLIVKVFSSYSLYLLVFIISKSVGGWRQMEPLRSLWDAFSAAPGKSVITSDETELHGRNASITIRWFVQLKAGFRYQRKVEYWPWCKWNIWK